MANNQNVNKVVYAGTTLIDLTGDDVTAASVLSGKKFHLPSGAAATGTIATKTASNITASGATVTVPAGYYASQATKSVATGSATAPSSISGTSATVSTGTNTLSLTKTVSVTPSVSAGYVSSGTAGNSSVSLTASVTTKAAATITPSTSNQTIAAGTYLTGAQTIAGSSNLVAGNIKSGVSIFGVSGSYSNTSLINLINASLTYNQIRRDSNVSLTRDGITVAYDSSSGKMSITNDSRTAKFSTGSTSIIISQVAPVSGHKYAILGQYETGVLVAATTGGSLGNTAYLGSILTGSTGTEFKIRITSAYDFVTKHPVGNTYSFYLNIVDITKMFGASIANSLSYNDIAAMFPNNHYSYNSGQSCHLGFVF